VYKFELTTLNDAPVLGPGVALLSMPGGERILSALYYLGSLLVLGTNRGVRVCAFDTYYGTISLGPLSFEAPVTALGGYDRYVFAGGTDAGNGASTWCGSTCPRRWTTPGTTRGRRTCRCRPARGDRVRVPATTAGKWSGVKGVGCLEELTAPGRPRRGSRRPDPHGHGRGQALRVRTVRGSYVRDLPVTCGRPARPDPESTWTPVHTAPGPPSGSSCGAARGVGGAAVLPDRRSAAVLLPGAGAARREAAAAAVAAGVAVGLPADPLGHRGRVPGLGAGAAGAIEAPRGAGAEITVSAPALFPEAVRGVIERIEYAQPTDVGDSTTGTHGVLTLVLRTTA
jgi:hypothetical protein